mmetsp:Transcript_100782/g.262720  ORF Transcript_100782/g.262720 Transcript_100782/m.262720 type:complete len:534 (-) Transcript_100782:245-1846(-)
MTSRLRVWFPTPHSAEHSDHSDQSTCTQSTGAPLLQPQGGASPGPGLHLTTSTMGPLHGLPRASLGFAMLLLRFLAPLHGALHSRGAHGPQSPKAQSCASSPQASSALHWRNSCAMPGAASPHSFGSTAATRLRICTPPPPQVALQGPQAPQSSQAPSTQSFGGGAQVPGQSLEGRTSSLARGEQGLPLPCGWTATSRDRRRKPTPHSCACWHSPHSCHSPHSQSVLLSQPPPSPSKPGPMQPVTSRSPMLQPAPPGLAAFSTSRSRTWCPWPHFSVHADHSDQSEARQSRSASHGSSLHGSDSLMDPSQAAPPNIASESSSRVRNRWPPPQLRPHSPQGAHSAKRQSALRSEGHGPACFVEPSQGRPRPFAGVTARVRKACRLLSCEPSSGPQPVQSDQPPSRQSASHSPAGQGSVPQGRTVSREPSQGAPPPLACAITSRDRFWPPPPPHVFEHSAQGLHSESLQSVSGSALSGCAQGSVSAVEPAQARPRGPASVAIGRRRRRWPSVPVHSVQADQSDLEQSCSASQEVL